MGEEGGEIPETTSGNAMRDATVLKGTGKDDKLEGVQLSMFKGCGGKMKIETLPDPFKMVEKELQPFSDSIKELVATDQPILSMAAKHFFEKRHGKRFRPTIVQLMAKAVAVARPEHMDSDSSTAAYSVDIDKEKDDFEKIGGAAAWQWSGASKINI